MPQYAAFAGNGAQRALISELTANRGVLAKKHNQTVVHEAPPTPKDSVLNSRKVGGYPLTTSDRSIPVSTIGHE